MSGGAEEEGPRICASCGTTGAGLKICTACRSVRYCDVACQKDHRKIHRAECKRIEKSLKSAAEGDNAEVKKDTAMEENTTCPICLEDFPEKEEDWPPVQVMGLNCGHLVHYPCILEQSKFGLKGEKEGYDGMGLSNPEHYCFKCPCCRMFSGVHKTEDKFWFERPVEKVMHGALGYLFQASNNFEPSAEEELNFIVKRVSDAVASGQREDALENLRRAQKCFKMFIPLLKDGKVKVGDETYEMFRKRTSELVAAALAFHMAPLIATAEENNERSQKYGPYAGKYIDTLGLTGPFCHLPDYPYPNFSDIFSMGGGSLATVGTDRPVPPGSPRYGQD